MPRQARMVVDGEPAVYHVISRTALDGFVLGDVEKDFLLKLVKRLSSVYFTEILGFCWMGNHTHLVVRMLAGEKYADDEIRKRFKLYYGKGSKRELLPGQIPLLRLKWASLSEYVKEVKQGFSRFYNKRHRRKGFFWSERFKSVIVEEGETLINLLAYVDLNPVRAGLVKRPEDYRWCSLGYHLQADNKDGFLSLDFGLAGAMPKGRQERVRYYRQFVYEQGSLERAGGARLDEKVVEREKQKGFRIDKVDRFRNRTRYFTDSGIIGTKGFVLRCYESAMEAAGLTKEKRPVAVAGLPGVYSLKRLSERL